MLCSLTISCRDYNALALAHNEAFRYFESHLISDIIGPIGIYSFFIAPTNGGDDEDNKKNFLRVIWAEDESLMCALHKYGR